MVFLIVQAVVSAGFTNVGTHWVRGFLKLIVAPTLHFEAKLGIMYSGKELESKKAKHRRYRLKEKVVYGGIEGADGPALGR